MTFASLPKRIVWGLALFACLDVSPAGAQFTGPGLMPSGLNSTSSAFGNIVTNVGALDTARHILGLGTADSPTFSGLTVNGNASVVSGSFGLSGNLSIPAWTTNGARYKNGSATITDTTSSGTVATAYTSVWGGNTIAASSATTYTNYIGAYFTAPTAGTNVTFTNNAALGADSLYVAGKVGIGTTGPGAQLHVQGTGQATQTAFSTTGATGGTLYLQDSGAGVYNGGALMLGAGQGAFAVIKGLITDGSNNTTGDITIATRRVNSDATLTNALYINGISGNVGIGTSTPQSLLSLAPSSTGLRNYNSYTDASNGEWYETVWSSNVLTLGTNKNGTGVARALNIETGGSVALTIDTSQKVGIGTASPGAQLTVQGGGQQTETAFNTAGNLGGALILDDSTGGVYGGGALIFSNSSQARKFAVIKGAVTNGANNTTGDIMFGVRPVSTDSTLTTALLIQNSGNVGIGTTTPQALLSLAPSSSGFRNYNSYTDASNGEWYESVWAANVLTMGTNKNGTGVVRNISLEVGGTSVASLTAAIADFTQPVRTSHGYTVAGLPAAGTAGRRAYVTDQLTTCAAAGAALTGGGAVTCPVFDNGAAWVGD